MFFWVSAILILVLLLTILSPLFQAPLEWEADLYESPLALALKSAQASKSEAFEKESDSTESKKAEAEEKSLKNSKSDSEDSKSDSEEKAEEESKEKEE